MWRRSRMRLASPFPVLLAATLAGGLAAPRTAQAMPQVAGPISIEASRGDGDVQNGSAILTTTITNQSSLPDRLVRATCPGYGGLSLANPPPGQPPGQPAAQPAAQPVAQPTVQPTAQPGQPLGQPSAQPAGELPGQPPGIELPGAVAGRGTPVQVQFRLTGATQSVAAGSLVPCALYFARDGERIVIFSLGAREPLASEP